ncbi:MAG: Rieske 2Fe-2S domain-containing protein [Novosphingobium sp.]
MGEKSDVLYLDDMPEATGFPTKVMPTSWFQVDWSDALKIGDVKPLKYFNQDLALFRTADGRANLTSAYCPHMGAHLGYGGTVEGCTLKCPYHGWEWNTDGTSALVPSEGKPSTSRRGLKVWDVVESNGIIWTWHDSRGRPPLWDAPAERRHEDNYLPVYPHCTYTWADIRARPQYIAENTVDLDHLIFVHKNGILPVVREEAHIPQYTEEGHIWANRRPHPMQSSACIGIGLVVVTFPFDESRPHRMPGVLFHCTTPIDDERSDMFGTMMVRQDMAAEGCEGDVPVGNALKRVEEQIKQAGRDVPIWDHMIYMERPAYTRMEGPQFMRLRRWAKQFYPEGDGGEATGSVTPIKQSAA